MAAGPIKRYDPRAEKLDEPRTTLLWFLDHRPGTGGVLPAVCVGRQPNRRPASYPGANNGAAMPATTTVAAAPTVTESLRRTRGSGSPGAAEPRGRSLRWPRADDGSSRTDPSRVAWFATYALRSGAPAGEQVRSSPYAGPDPTAPGLAARAVWIARRGSLRARSLAVGRAGRALACSRGRPAGTGRVHRAGHRCRCRHGRALASSAPAARRAGAVHHHSWLTSWSRFDYAGSRGWRHPRWHRGSHGLAGDSRLRR